MSTTADLIRRAKRLNPKKPADREMLEEIIRQLLRSNPDA